jgi:2-oxoglutarate dehydrogenase E2 component (dihydrolipoamide succinyltransferase)
MLIEIKVPSVGESVTEALLAQWFKNDGDLVKKDEPLFVIETDKVTLEVVAEADGVLAIKVAEGETVAIGAVVGTLDPAAAATGVETEAAEVPRAETPPPEPERPEAPESVPAPQPKPPQVQPTAPVSADRPPAEPARFNIPPEPGDHILNDQPLAPSVRRLVAERGLNPALIPGTGPHGRLTKGDVVLFLENSQAEAKAAAPDLISGSPTVPAPAETQPPAAILEAELINRKPMSPLRQRIAARLLEAKQNTAMLTTFNEIDMTRVMAIRKQYKESFKQKYQINLGMMSFFIKASVEALKEISQINAFIDGKDIIEHHYYHIGVAVGSERGLVVPVIRHADRLNFAGLEQAIVDYVNKINENRLEISDLEGGTFTISNGGVYGSLLSTPILNIPQSAILGMHKIEKRPVVVDEEIVIRPMMYVALSYDHRIVDGREAVTFLKRIKEFVENPERIMMEI